MNARTSIEVPLSAQHQEKHQAELLFVDAPPNPLTLKEKHAESQDNIFSTGAYDSMPHLHTSWYAPLQEG